MSGAQETRKPRLPFYKRTVTITLAPARAITLALVLLAAIIWFFFLGLIVGRGQYPEASIPEVGRMMPRSNGTDVPLRVVTVESDEDEAAVSPSNPRLDTGRGEDAASPMSGASSQADDRSRPPSPQNAVRNAEKTVQPAAVAEETFDYTYQVASFKEPKGAEALAQTLKKDGLKARVATSQGEKTLWHRVVVEFRGTPTQTDDLRAKLAGKKITKIMMLTKKPVKQ